MAKIKESEALLEIRRIREANYERRKNMTREEYIDDINQKAEKTRLKLKKHKILIIKSKEHVG